MLNVFKVERYKMKKFTPFYVCLFILFVLVVEMITHGVSQAALDYYGYTNQRCKAE